MKFTLSTNINNLQFDDFHYIPTSNSRRVVGNILSDFHSGIHSFTLVGTYGTGKSSFLVALEKDLLQHSKLLFDNKGQLNNYKKFQCLNIIGEYNSLSNLLSDKLECDNIVSKNIFLELDKKIKTLKSNNEFLVIVIDEFGKILEHAANNNPEKELYFLQQFAEYINNPKNDNVLLITTLHQSFVAYSKKLTEQQRNEWEKVKGRFKEIVFSEPVEQLLFLAASQIEKSKFEIVSEDNFNTLFNLAKSSKFIHDDFDINIARKLYPMDVFSAVVLTYSIQRYGQNERSLFSFLNSNENNSINSFNPAENITFNLSNVYDYIIYNFYSYLSEVNTDSANWRAIRVALERIEGLFDVEEVEVASKIVKVIGLCNLFGNSIIFDRQAICEYLELALGINEPGKIIDNLVALKIIRYAKYKSQYIIFEGTDINIEDELYKAAGQVPYPTNIIDDLNSFFDFKVVQANASYYKTGTPRFFEYKLTTEAFNQLPSDDVDGYINLVFSDKTEEKEEIANISKTHNNAIIYVYFKNVDEIVDHLYEIKKLEYVRTHVLIEDKIADRELQNLIIYEKDILNKAINHSLTSFSSYVEWYYKGSQVQISSKSDFNKLLSQVCDEIYYSTPIISNELFNKQKVNSAVSLARVSLLNRLIDDDLVVLDDLGYENDKFPPEKTIYYSLLKNTGIHREINGAYTLTEPNSELIKDLWDECENFLKESIAKQQKLGDLIKKLKLAPYRLKQGFLDLWIPIYLIIKKQDYSLYDSEDRYIPYINKEVLDLLQKSPNDFRVKAFAIGGIKLEFFNQYRNFINLHDKELITQDNFLETIKPFLVFYNNLNDFAKSTQNFDNPHTAKFRDVLGKAKDPEKTFFEDLPEAFGYNNNSLASSQVFMTQYQNLLKDAVRDLRNSYPNLIKQIESNLIDVLGLKSNNYSDYKNELKTRFKSIQSNLLSNKQKQFYNRLISTQADRVQWYESISYVILNKSLTSVRDNEVPMLIESMKHLLLTISKFVDLSKISKNNTESEFYNFELISNNGSIKPKSYILSEKQKEKTIDLERKINDILSGDDNLDVCTLLRIIKNKTKE